MKHLLLVLIAIALVSPIIAWLSFCLHDFHKNEGSSTDWFFYLAFFAIIVYLLSIFF